MGPNGRDLSTNIFHFVMQCDAARMSKLNFRKLSTAARRWKSENFVQHFIKSEAYKSNKSK